VNAGVIQGVEVSPEMVARRALELARDRAVSLDDAVRHLLRLADARSTPLEHALADLRQRERTAPEVDYACILVRSAIGAAAAPPFFGGSRGSVVPA
jgi:hypothetical protein